MENKYEELEKLLELKKNGTLTDEEFEKEKKIILSDTSNINEDTTNEQDFLKGFKICPACKAANREERYCHNCGMDLLMIKPYSGVAVERNTQNTTRSEEKNKIAYKFIIVATIVRVLCCIVGLILAIAFITLEQPIIGIIYGVVLVISGFFWGLILDAIAEVINLLQDIKNK